MTDRRLVFSIVLSMVLIMGADLEARSNVPSPPEKKPRPLGGSQSLSDQERSYQASYPLTKLPDPMAVGSPTPATNFEIAQITSRAAEWTTESSFQPSRAAVAAKAEGQAQATSAANAAGEAARDQAISSIDYCSKFMTNFTTEAGNKWNRVRNEIFLPMAVLLLLPGAVLTQVRAIIAAGSPIIGNHNPLEGIQRSVVAVFLIPGSYLVVNYGIDFANSVTYTIASEYKRLFHSDMYKDAICAEIRAFSPRHQAENDSSLKVPPFNKQARNNGIFSKTEADWGKLQDPCSNLNEAPKDRDDAAAPASTIAKRLMLNTSNAGINTSWGILCAFQMAYMYYLFFVGPIMAALWVWPTKLFRDAFPSWVEGVITLCFWSFFWNTVILLMACFKGVDDTGLIVMTALNFLASAAVKYAFDFAGLVKAAGQKAAELAEKAAQGGGGGQSGGAGAGKGQAAQTSASPAPSLSAQRPLETAAAGEPPMPETAAAAGAPLPYGSSYANAAQTGSSIYGRRTDGSMPVILPPFSSDRPGTMIGADGSIAFFTGRTGAGQYESVNIIDPATSEPISLYRQEADGRIAVFSPQTGAYIVPTITTGGRSTDRFRLDSTVMQGFDATRNMYIPFNPFQDEVNPPPSAALEGEALPNAEAVMMVGALEPSTAGATMYGGNADGVREEALGAAQLPGMSATAAGTLNAGVRGSAFTESFSPPAPIGATIETSSVPPLASAGDAMLLSTNNALRIAENHSPGESFARQSTGLTAMEAASAPVATGEAQPVQQAAEIERLMRKIDDTINGGAARGGAARGLAQIMKGREISQLSVESSDSSISILHSWYDATLPNPV
ncbi:MAG TPA: hypothetical protein V6D17_20995 [Candidatus Obscuribacterales bacterium]